LNGKKSRIRQYLQTTLWVQPVILCIQQNIVKNTNQVALFRWFENKK